MIVKAETGCSVIDTETGVPVTGVAVTVTICVLLTTDGATKMVDTDGPLVDKEPLPERLQLTTWLAVSVTS